MEGTFFACRPLQYGPSFPADMIDLHQVFEMRNEQNDEQLLRLRFVAPLPPKAPLVVCGPCGKKFTSEFALNRHGKLRHEAPRAPQVKDDTLGRIDTNDPDQLLARAQRLQREMQTTQLADGMVAPNPDADAEVAARAEEKLIDEISPIAWDKTQAALKADDVKVPEVTSPTRKTSKRPAASKGRKKAGA